MTETAAQSASVWITRPEPAATELAGALEQQGLRALAVPTLAITAPDDVFAIRNRAQQCLEPGGIAIFVSRNAVDWFWQLLAADSASLLAAMEVVAVGPATAAALESRAGGDIVTPQGQADSEALLALPSLQQAAVAGRTVAIVRGSGGRELLAETLRERGARIEYLEVYVRRPCRDTAAVMPQLWQQQPPAAIVTTSPAGLRALVDMTPADCQASLLATRLLCLGRRLPEQARALGFEDCIPVSATGGNAAIVRALADESAGRPGQAPNEGNE